MSANAQLLPDLVLAAQAFGEFNEARADLHRIWCGPFEGQKLLR